MKILLSLPEFPFAHHGGAARSLRTMAEMLVAAGHQAFCIATTATERKCDTREILSTLQPQPGAARYAHRGVRYAHRGVNYRILETGGTTSNWRTLGTEWAYREEFNEALRDVKPDILLAYGGYPSDEKRYARAKAQGCKIVFGLRNFGYPSKQFFAPMDGVLTCSRFLTDWYRTKIGIESTPLPLPIWPEDVIAEKRHDPVYFTAINPARRKGSLLLLTIFRELHRTRLDIPLRIVGESNEAEFAELSKYAAVIPWQTNPKEIYQQTKVLLVPSVWEEPAGRVIAEAMLNGIPPIITDRGGMVEVANGGAFVVPLAKRIDMKWSGPVPLNVAQPWIDLIIELHDRRVMRFNEMGDRAKAAAAIYQPENLTARYVDYFERILAGQPVEQQDQPCMDLAALTEARSHTAAGRPDQEETHA